MGDRILVVDDEDTIRMVLTEVLTDDGYDVTEAANGEQALEAFRQKPFPVVLSDIYMGNMTGIDLLKEIKLIDEDALVLIMTSNASLDTAPAALRGGAYDYLMKPFDELDLISNVVSRAMDKFRLSRDNRELIEKLQENAKRLEALNRQLREAANYVLELASGLSEWARAPLCLPAVQYMAYYRALSRGLNPDEPRNLSYWVDTSG